MTDPRPRTMLEFDRKLPVLHDGYAPGALNAHGTRSMFIAELDETARQAGLEVA